MTKSPKTLVTLLLDRSGSMQTLKDDTLGALNAYIDRLRQEESDIRFSLVQFDAPDFAAPMALEKVHVARPVAEIPDLGPDDFIPRGGTPLIDAACATIRAVAESLEGREKTRVVVAIQTDGQENRSVENSWNDLKALIAEKEKAGWEFVFMGCEIDAYKQGAMMGVSPDKTLSYGKDPEATRAAFAATAANTAHYAAGTLGSMDYTAAQKMEAGDPDARRRARGA